MIYYIWAITIFILATFLVIFYCLPRRRRANSVAFFHLYCSSGGGGERVLWHAVESLINRYPHYTIYIYSHKDIEESSLRTLLNVRDLFNIDLVTNEKIIDQLIFVPLRLSPLVDAKHYPYLTLLFQNLASILVSIEASWRVVPQIYFETIGFTFTLPVFKLHQCTVLTYVHYPTISSDMITSVKTSKHGSFNNREIFVKSPFLRSCKLVYYRLLAILYGLAGRQADLVMVNSSWTKAHILSLWSTKVNVVYPPCDVASFKEISSIRSHKESNALKIVSIAQFRPEKNHNMQIEAFDMFLARSKARGSMLTLYGGCRDDNDRERVHRLHDDISSLGLITSVDIVVSAPFDRLLQGMSKADVAIHTMANEHFGIVVVECMASGLITIAHKSGGPKEDIIDDGKNGFLAKDVEDFAEKLVKISNMTQEERDRLRQNAMSKADLFSVECFQKTFIELVDKFFAKKK